MKTVPAIVAVTVCACALLTTSVAHATTAGRRYSAWSLENAVAYAEYIDRESDQLAETFVVALRNHKPELARVTSQLLSLNKRTSDKLMNYLELGVDRELSYGEARAYSELVQSSERIKDQINQILRAPAHSTVPSASSYVSTSSPLPL